MPLEIAEHSDKGGDMKFSKKEKKTFSKDVLEHEGCHIWMGRVTKQGVGKADVGSWSTTARKAAYTLAHNKLPKGNLKMSCGVRLCVNPSHMVPIETPATKVKVHGSHADISGSKKRDRKRTWTKLLADTYALWKESCPYRSTPGDI